MESKRVYCDRCGQDNGHPMDVEFADNATQIRLDLCHTCAISALFHRVSALSDTEKTNWLKSWKSFQHEEKN